jgi:hypothetical protein
VAAATAFGHSVKLCLADVSRQASIGPQAQSAVHAADWGTQLFTLHAVQSAPTPAPMVGREPSHAKSVPESDDAVSESDDVTPESDDPAGPSEDALHPAAASVTAKPSDNHAPGLIPRSSVRDPASS